MLTVITYLIPTSFFEFLFFLIIFGSAVVVALLVRKNANATAWEFNWQSGTIKENEDGHGHIVCDCCKGTGFDPENNEAQCPKCSGVGMIAVEDADKDDLHPEHGSVFELSDHVMTASEKCADVRRENQRRTLHSYRCCTSEVFCYTLRRYAGCDRRKNRLRHGDERL